MKVLNVFVASVYANTLDLDYFENTGNELYRKGNGGKWRKFKNIKKVNVGNAGKTKEITKYQKNQM